MPIRIGIDRGLLPQCASFAEVSKRKSDPSVVEIVSTTGSVRVGASVLARGRFEHEGSAVPGVALGGVNRPYSTSCRGFSSGRRCPRRLRALRRADDHFYWSGRDFAFPLRRSSRDGAARRGILQVPPSFTPEVSGMGGSVYQELRQESFPPFTTDDLRPPAWVVVFVVGGGT